VDERKGRHGNDLSTRSACSRSGSGRRRAARHHRLGADDTPDL